MNSAVIAILGLLWLVVAYFIYGKFIEKKLIAPNDSNPTPAHRLKDGVDFYPAKPLVLFGHHFSSIAGAGPIVGPIIAVSVFGFGASLLWILVGVVFIGAVHDYTTAMLSVRNDGKSIPELASGLVGKEARLMFQIFVWITLIFVIAVFAVLAKNTFVSDPRVVIPAFGLIPLAVVFGWLTNRLNVPLWLATLVSWGALAGLFALGMQIPVDLSGLFSKTVVILGQEIPRAKVVDQIWIGILMLYGLAAAVLPVWILLQPRDYIGYWILAFGIIAGFIGLFVTHKPVLAPMFTAPVTDKGPIWPMLFIIVACGAVSGFHSLVASGTTSKQLNKESQALPVVFGGMITEGALAMLALLAVTAGLSWAASDGVASELPALQSIMGQKTGGGPIVAFATGFGTFTKPFLGGFGVIFGVTMINAFVLTTLDTSVRLGRFITVELAGPVLKPLQNRYAATGLVVVASWILAATGSVWSLWKVFGAANQLVAALAMLVVTVYLMEKKKPTVFTLAPAIFMLVTTMGALSWQGYQFVTSQTPNYTLATAAIVLLALAVFVGVRSLKTVFSKKAG